jgi:hypothetical protein
VTRAPSGGGRLLTFTFPDLSVQVKMSACAAGTLTATATASNALAKQGFCIVVFLHEVETL